MTTPRFWLRWSLRDARARWLQIVATGLVLALGVGAFAGLGGIRSWRERSSAESFQAARYHDLRVTLGEGGYAPAGTMQAALARLEMVAAAQERLVVDVQIDASRTGRKVVVPGRIVGIDLRSGDVDHIAPQRGRGLTAADAARRVAVLEAGFAGAYGLPAAGRIRVVGHGELPYVGVGMHPQTYLIVDEGVSGVQSRFANVFVPLAAAQALTAHRGLVNELAVRLRDGADVAVAEARVRRALASALPGEGATITRGTDEDVYRILFRDARNDQSLYRLFALLIVAAAGFAAFNLIGRAVDAQRREIGIGMALGVAPRRLAIRPLLMAAEIGVVGAALSVAIGIASSEALKSSLAAAYPLPHYASGVQWGDYPLGIALALVLPLIAAVAPVRRSIRLRPIEAIDISPRASAAASGRCQGRLERLQLPGRSLAQMPLRNVARAPRRTLLTVLGLAGVIAAVVAILGMVDSLQATADRSRAESLRVAPERVVAGLDGFRQRSDPAVRALLATPAAGRTEGGLTVGATVEAGEERVGVALSLVDRARAIWRPTIESGRLAGGIVLAERAAKDLGVGVGDSVVLRHPRRTGDGYTLAGTRVAVAGIHASPARAYAYGDTALAATLGLDGLVNTVTAVPRAGGSAASVQDALLGRPGVSSVEPARASVDTLQGGVDTFAGAISITVVLTLVLALLIAFGTASVAVEERRREYATMFAFGVPVRTALALAIAENAIVGALATIAGTGLGIALLGWIVNALLPQTFPDLGAVVSFSGTSLLITVAVGLGSVAAAPLLMRRRLRRMNLPSTLRVVE